MTTSGKFAVTQGKRLRANWPVLLLPLVAVDTLGLFHNSFPRFLLVSAFAAVILAPRTGARMTPFAFFAYGGYGLFLYHSVSVYESWPTVYGIVSLVGGANGNNMGLIVPQAIAFLAAGVWLLLRTGGPGSRAVRLAVAQLRGTGGQPKTVPPLLLLLVVLLWEELLGELLWFPWTVANPGANLNRAFALVIVLAAVAVVAWRPGMAAALAVAGLLLYGLYGAVDGGWHLLAGIPSWLPYGTDHGNFNSWLWGWEYGAVPLNSKYGALPATLQGLALLGVGCAVAPRLLTWNGDLELAQRAQALTQRVSRLSQTRTDATDTAVAELRRIERDLHDGAQARLVAVGMSLRAAEQLIAASPEAALALVAEARETSSRALADLRDLVRGIYPPVLADRGLADAVRTLAMDTPMTVETDITLSGEPPMPVAAAVYFGIAEVLTNAVRHSAADTVQIGIGYAGGVLRATVTDDGVGGADMSRGTGLAGVERRLATFDGVLAVSSPPGGPTIVAMEVPCELSGTDAARFARLSWQTPR